MRKRVAAAITGGVILAIAAIVGIAAIVLTQTDWGRARVGGYVIGIIRSGAHGYVDVQRIDGNLLTGATIVGLDITDSSRAPFVRADTVVIHYTIGGLVAKRLYFNDVRIVRPVIVIDRMPGGKWNYDRIFPRDTTQPPGPPGFLSWVALRNVTVVDGHVTARSPWAPSDTLSPTVRDSIIRVAMGPLGRLNITRVAGGFQKTSDFRDIYGTFPLMRLEDPSDKRQIIDVATVRMTAEPLKPPSVRVTDAKGRFILLADSLYFKDIVASLAESRLSHGNGRYNFDTNDLRLRLRGDTVATNDLLWIDPTIPKDGHGKLDFALDWIGPASDYLATNTSLAVAGARMSGSLGVLVTDTLAFHDTNVRLTHLDTRTIQQVFPTIKSPRRGFVSGRVAAKGGFGAMYVNGDVSFEDPISGTSRVIARGTVGASRGVLRATALHVTLAPLRVALARAVDPTLPIGGTVSGTALLDGSTDRRMAAHANLVHLDVTGPSHVTGSAVFARGGRIPLINANLQLLPLSLATAGKFMPAAGLHGTVTGPVTLTGPMRALAVSSDLTTTDGGSVTTRGTLDLESRPQSYDLTLTAHLFDVSQVTTKGPRTSVSADFAARGTGFDPATLSAVASANIRTSVYDSVSVDSATVRVAAADGLLTIDTLALNVPHGAATASGKFGLVAGRVGKLTYAASIDSLGALSRILPPADTGAVAPRPAVLGARVARADTARVRMERATAVERAVTGRQLGKFPVDTPRAIPRQALSGSLATSGSVTGNVHTFDMSGSASGRSLVAFGSSVGALTANYAWQTAFTPQSHVNAQVSAVNVLAAGFALDTVAFTAAYAKPNGTVSLVIHQDSNVTYNATGQFALDNDHDELRLDQLRLRFDTTVYASAGPSTVRFDSTGFSIDRFDIRSASGGRVFVNGTVPSTGAANLKVDVTQFEISNATALLQSDVPARGLVSVDARLQGTRAAPVIAGAFGMERFFYKGHATPEVHGRLSYSNETLQASVNAGAPGKTPAIVATGTVPINLALSGVTGSRVPRDRTIAVSVDADSLPLELVPEFTNMVSNLGGRGLAKFTIGGTVNSPDVNGRVTLWNGSARIVPLGLVVNDVATNIRLVHDTVIVDSLVARSNGTVRLAGGIGIKNLAEPSFALKLTARDARVIDNEMGNLFVNANIGVSGPYNNVEVTGFAHVLRGVLYIPESNGKTLVGAGDPALYSVLDTNNVALRDLFPDRSPLLANLRMDVALMVDRDVFVRSRDANVEVYTDAPLRISVNNAKQSFLIDGVILSDRGEYRFQSRLFQIRQLAATFTNTPDLNPILQVTGEYDVQLPTREAIAIRIVISGTLNAPKIALESDAQPPISQTDLLSYLAFGRSSSSLLQQEGSGLTTGGSGGGNIVGAGAAFAAKQVAAAALGALTDEAAGQAARSLGADFFNITPADVSLDAGSFLRATQVEFGKYIQTNTFLQIQVRPDPASLQRPGFDLTHRFNTRTGYRIDASFEPRYLLKQPTLATNQTPQTTSAFGLFLVREWRY
ncbi:MAG: translocation/assembly module TamB [Gemmatimonadota bacterium]|nr:translocation/assembly module TamB [Gemmatimonadota bacterium]